MCLFYSWCLTHRYEGSSSVVIGDVDCTVEQDLCSKFGVSGYPTLKVFTAEAPEGKPYEVSGKEESELVEARRREIALR